ncbi:GNAT family N-acetyltransferase [Brucepastera parasyntrophica]|uniref:GNAT family N-acetyltransferase n=1 Tax=Brucepastera parasyntrophica TaxID=2880008 RepID=UPI00210C279F|nr:GNAT family protein [Brucepastera parasyntrophica]ULQ58598.1 GNAT family N-acetyltransferase [Brucepastera parasyntrophica]
MRIRKLTGEKCFLSPMDTEDADLYAQWLNDLSVVRNTSMSSKVITKENEKDILRQLSQEHNYGIIDMETDELIGSCGLMDIDSINRTCETGIMIGNSRYWDRGYGTESLYLLIDYAFKYLTINNILLRVFSFNERAVRCYKKLGFREIGKRRNAVILEMKYHDIIFMDLLPEDFYREQ